MAFSELIKNFNHVRQYMRDFYVYGFKSREEYTAKSLRSYDDVRRRIENWLGEYMMFRLTADGKNLFLSIDSRITSHNPLFEALKTKSFTDADITLFFIIFDILSDSTISMTVQNLCYQIDEYLSRFPDCKTYDESTIRKKLNEYTMEGLLISEKKGKSLVYRRAAEETIPLPKDALDFFSEVSPCGIIGSYLLDQTPNEKDLFAFKHHYITSALDSEILYQIFSAMSEKKQITIESFRKKNKKTLRILVVPLKIMISVQNGRQYLMAYSRQTNRISSYRIDNILTVKSGEREPLFDDLRTKFQNMLPHIWGVSTQGFSGERIEHVEFVIRYGKDEPYIPKRLEREKRVGKVEHLDDHTSRFSADVYDVSEMLPWIRTFICRIVSIHFSDKKTEKRFLDDLHAMYNLYGIGGENDDLQ